MNMSHRHTQNKDICLHVKCMQTHGHTWGNVKMHRHTWRQMYTQIHTCTYKCSLVKEKATQLWVSELDWPLTSCMSLAKSFHGSCSPTYRPEYQSWSPLRVLWRLRRRLGRAHGNSAVWPPPLERMVALLHGWVPSLHTPSEWPCLCLKVLICQVEITTDVSATIQRMNDWEVLGMSGISPAQSN